MKKVFEIVYYRLKEKAVDKNVLCSEFWMKVVRLKESYDENTAWELFVNNIQWLVKSDVVKTSEIIKWFDQKELERNNIFSNGNVDAKDGFIIGLGNVKIVAAGHSRIILFDSAQCEAHDSSFVSAYDNSKVELNDCIGESFGNTKVEAKGYSKVELWEDSKCNALNYSFVIQHENSKVKTTGKVHVLKQ